MPAACYFAWGCFRYFWGAPRRRRRFLVLLRPPQLKVPERRRGRLGRVVLPNLRLEYDRIDAETV